MREGAAPRLRRDIAILLALSAAYLAITFTVSNSYYQLILTLVPIWAVFGVSWNILSGYGGQLSFGHASFFGIGAYVVTLALVYWDLTPWLGIPLGMLVGAVAAVLIGTPTFRLRGHYFALSMLAYPLAILYFLQYLGFQEVSLPMHRENPAAYLEFTDPRLYTVTAVGLLIAGVLACMAVENSRFGLALLAIRQNELAAEAAGIDAWMWKMRAIVVSGAIAAAAGGLYACVLLVVTPDSVFGMLVSAQAVVVTLFGGVASIWGPVIGAAILVPLASTLNAELGNYLPGIQGVVYGAAMIGIMLAAPDGLYWTVRDALLRRGSQRDLQSGPQIGRRAAAPEDTASATSVSPSGQASAGRTTSVSTGPTPATLAPSTLAPPTLAPPTLAPPTLAPPTSARAVPAPATSAFLPTGHASPGDAHAGGAIKPEAGMARPSVEGERPLLVVQNLSRSFGGLRAVSQVSFEVHRGEILGIIGPNGAGKTTLFNVLNGVLAADEGRAELDGVSMLGKKVHQVARMGVGRTFQVVRSFPRLPLADNVVVGAYGAGLSDAAAIEATSRALQQVGLQRHAQAMAGQLTNKQLRLMELARALAGQPRILLLDETLAGLGRDECDDVLDVLAALRRDGITVVIIEHTMHAMMRIADRFVVLDHGRVLASGLPRTVVEDRAVIEAYLGKKWLARQDA